MTRSELARVIWQTSRADESTISATGANIVADAILDGPIHELLRQARREAWDEGRCAAARGQKNNPYVEENSVQD